MWHFSWSKVTHLLCAIPPKVYSKKIEGSMKYQWPCLVIYSKWWLQIIRLCSSWSCGSSLSWVRRQLWERTLLSTPQREMPVDMKDEYPLSLPSHQAFTETSNLDTVSTHQNKNTYKNQPWRKHHGVGPFPEPSELLSFQTPASVTPRWDPSSSLPWPHSGEMDLSPQLTWMGSYHSSHKLSCQLHCSENKISTCYIMDVLMHIHCLQKLITPIYKFW